MNDEHSINCVGNGGWSGSGSVVTLVHRLNRERTTDRKNSHLGGVENRHGTHGGDDAESVESVGRKE